MVKSVSTIGVIDAGSGAIDRVTPPGGWGRPGRREGIVPRSRLTTLLSGAADATAVVILAPAGYGKTTTTLLWEDADDRDFIWVHLDRLDDEPVHLLRHLAHALAAAGAIDPERVKLLWGGRRSVDLELLPAIGRALRLDGPIVLVLDDAHLVQSPVAQRCIDGFAAYLPAGSQLALVGRSLPSGSLSERRMAGTTFELDAADLAMAQNEAELLFAGSGLQLETVEVAALVSRTEGWPGGLHLAALALKRRTGSEPSTLLTGRDRLVTDYLIDEVLSDYPDDLVQFLMRSSVVERMTPAMLDELLGSTTSGQQLLEVERSGNLFLVALDHERRWYRYHQLFREALRGRLELLDPRECQRLESRASRLLEQQGDVDGAIRHTVAAAEQDRAAALAAAHSYGLVNEGLIERLRSWVELLGSDAIDKRAEAAVAWAWYALAIGDSELVRRATAAAERQATNVSTAAGTPSMVVAAALIRAIMGLDGVDGVVEDAEAVRDAGGPQQNPWWAAATMIQGTALAMRGDVDVAEERLQSALRLINGSPLFEAGILAHLANLRLEQGDLVEAAKLSSRALEMAEDHLLDGVLVAVSVYAVGALVAARSGDQATSRKASLTTMRLLGRMEGLSPRTALFCNILLAEAGLTLGDPSAAADFAAEARRARRCEPEAHRLNERLDALEEHLDSWPAGPASASPRLTPAELRLLDYLPTHLNMQQIAEQLGVTRNTAKSQNVAVYRKLGVASRSDAVAEARRLNIIHD